MSDEVRGTSEQRIAEVRARLERVTPGPWFVWDGHGYIGGGRDLCIGAGPDWLANMDSRACRRRIEHSEVYATCELELDADVCSLAGDVSAEQEANANFIARAREDVPFLLSVVDYQDKAIEELHVEHERRVKVLDDRIDALYQPRRVDKQKAAAIFARLDPSLQADKEIRWIFGTLLGVDLASRRETPHPALDTANIEQSEIPSSDERDAASTSAARPHPGDPT